MKRDYDAEVVILNHMQSPFGPLPFHIVSRSPLYHKSPTYKASCEAYIRQKNRVDSLYETMKILKFYVEKRHYEAVVRSEADVSVAHTGEVRASVTDVHQNLEDIGGEEKDDVIFHKSHDHFAISDDFSMKGYLERPVQIAALSLSLDSDIDLSFNIWDLFLADPVVRAKIRNFAFLRTDLKVRIAVSGTPFHYGRLLVAYEPFPSMNPYLSSFGPTFRQERLRYLSQAPGAKTMDVRENTPLEMSIPYVSPLPVGRLYNDSTLVLTAAENFDDFTGLGSLYISTLNQIKGVNATVTNVFLYVYVMAENISLHGTTGSVGQITSEADEREKGPVHRISSSALKISRVLEQIPMINPFAKASSIALSAVSGISALFGWSYPTLIGKPERYRPEPFQNGAQTIGIDTGKRITLDPKQELHVDPRICAVDEDELAIASIAGREGLLDTFTWAPGDTSLTDIIWQVAVTPRANKSYTNTTEYIVPTPLSFASMPFKYWRGTMKFRFEIVASNFHRGKIMFAYEPNIRQFGLISAALNVNKQYCKVVDIQETQSIEFEVDWNFPRPFCKNLPLAAIGSTTGSQFANTASFAECANGILFVTPFTEIQSPDGSAIEINVFVSGSNFVFNRLTDEFLPDAVNPISESDDSDFNRGFSTKGLNENLSELNDISAHYFGEAPLSFRALLKRFVTSYDLTGDFTSDGVDALKISLPIYPTTPVSANNAGESGKNLYFYLKHAFLAMRGGLRRRLFLEHNSQKNEDFLVFASLNNDTSTTVTPSLVPAYNTIGYSNLDGTVAFVTKTNGGVEFETPCYTNNLFLWAVNDDPWDNTLSVIDPSGTRNYHALFGAYGQFTYNRATEHFAAGEDFTFIRWLGAYPISIGTPI